ncbi:regucalcin-like [Portunus trituberculatus]|uniref:regucalcin-like n=1 Tax=Portunus trituberculatus TaxID=210409 RepID=UPI001E1CC5F8|nr:regucalcin-like [Portunus trituberculatus]XP_045110874.1 regucalcin-like [Portunus trituberculatus]XP_045110879.1 regucalcin-like [Portunus trituberculatus]
MAGEGVHVQQVASKGLIIGEGPHWVMDRCCLLFVDIMRGEMHRLFTDTRRHQKLHVEPEGAGDSLSFVVPVKNHPDLYAVGLGRSVALVEWLETDPDAHTRKVKVTLHTVESDTPTNRFNDGKCDPRGRLWAGTMAQESAPGVLPKEKGHIFCLNNDLTLDCTMDKISLSNGLAWSHDKKTFYYIDSMAYSVDAFDYDIGTGKIGNRRQVVDFKAVGLDPDIPDGMCIDSNGDLWVACFYGAKVICIDPTTRKIKRKITMPTKNITSVCFGGHDYSTLYVTSSSLGLTPEEVKEQPAGATFAVTGLGVKGIAPDEFVVDEEVLKRKLG